MSTVLKTKSRTEVLVKYTPEPVGRSEKDKIKRVVLLSLLNGILNEDTNTPWVHSRTSMYRKPLYFRDKSVQGILILSCHPVDPNIDNESRGGS